MYLSSLGLNIRRKKKIEICLEFLVCRWEPRVEELKIVPRWGPRSSRWGPLGPWLVPRFAGLDVCILHVNGVEICAFN